MSGEFLTASAFSACGHGESKPVVYSLQTNIFCETRLITFTFSWLSVNKQASEVLTHFAVMLHWASFFVAGPVP